MLKAGEVVKAAQLKSSSWVLLPTAMDSATLHPGSNLNSPHFSNALTWGKKNKFHYQKKEFQGSSAIHITWELQRMLLKSVLAPRWQEPNQNSHFLKTLLFFPRELFWYYQWSPTCSKPRHKWFDWLGKWTGIPWLWAIGKCTTVLV